MIKIGITGHRDLNKEQLALYQRKVFLELKQLQNKYDKIIILSPLSDGADRLIVEQALKLDIEFIVALPMPLKEYEKDFTCSSKDEFYSLLSKAKKIITLEDVDKDRDTLYEQAGHYISDNCDILFALWDGKHTGLKGGTSEIVEYYTSKRVYSLYHLIVSRDNAPTNNNMVKFIKQNKKER